LAAGNLIFRRFDLNALLWGMSRSKRILFAPLDWGLGHATRCMPLIDRALDLGHQPVIAAGGRGAALLQGHYPQLEHYDFPGVAIKYGKNAAFDTLLLGPSLLRGVRREHLLLEELVKKYAIDLVVSDNRYGAWSKKTPSVFMSHQLAPLPPKSMYFTRPLLQWLLRYWLRPYSYLLVPDFEGEFGSLAGKLSHAWTEKRMRYLGPLSRLQPQPKSMGGAALVVVLSGPEPQRTIFERHLRQQLRYFDVPSLLVQGKPGPYQEQRDGHLHIVNALAPTALAIAIQQAELVVARSGYSTVMDLWQLGGRACFVPTPGQTEQEYLAERMAAMQICSYQSQTDFNIARAWEERAHFDGFRPHATGEGLKHWDEILSS
jgi:hypothetical protein